MQIPFLLRLFTTSAEPSYFASSVITPWVHKAGCHSYATYILPHNIPQFLCLVPRGGNLPQVPRAAGYILGLLDTIGFLQQHTTGKPYTLY
jgi:hypothetical protein